VNPPRQVWPEEFAERYRAAGYWRGETLGQLLTRRTAAHPGDVAIVCGETRWTFAEWNSKADAIAAGFLELGLSKRARVVVQLPNVPEFLSVTFGLYRAGLLPVFALPAHRHSEIAHFAASADAEAYVIPAVYAGFDYRALAETVTRDVASVKHVVVCDKDPGPYRSLLEIEQASSRSIADPAPSDVAFLQLSGGSTGLSKLIPRTHDDYLYSVRGSVEICQMDRTSRLMVALPIGHNYPMSSPGYLGALDAGGRIVICPSPTPEVAFPIIEREGVTIAGLVPPLALIWEQAAQTTTSDLSSLKILQVGGAKLTAELARRLRTTFSATLQQVFGMAEGLVNYTRLDDAAEVLVETQGRPISVADEVRIVDDSDVPVAPGMAGHLLTRGPYTIRAYHNAPEANRRAFTSDGFYRTGDIVRLRPDGNLEVQGRSSDMINRGGEKVSAEEIEDVILAHPNVHDVAVVAVPDPYLGERTCAVIVPKGERPRPAALKAWIRSRGIAAYKVPDRILLVDAFPETAVGKTSRKAIRAAIREDLAAPSSDTAN
jgi:2,3-dihydroxybenzoate-AMP ligase